MGTLVGRLPNGMVPLTVLLLVHDGGGTLALGGALCALYGLASAVGEPLLGRLVDRHGQTLPTSTALGLTTAALLALPQIHPAGHRSAASVLVVLAGLSTPPLEAGLRALWPTVLPDPEERRAALAIDTGSQGLIYVAGPPLAVAIANVFGPTAALSAAAVVSLGGAAAVLTSAPSRRWRPPARRRSLFGPLLDRGLRRLATALSGVGFALGALTVWALQAAGRHHAPWLAGTVPAALSVGSIATGALLARRSLPGPPTSQTVLATAAFATAWLPLLAHPSPVAAVAIVLVPGAFLTPLITNAFLTAERLAPPGTITEAYAWLVSAVGTGQAAGTALAGRTAEDHALATAALPALGSFAALTLLITGRHHLKPT
jgi:predicted MFS family arabinose efflux permease